MQPTKSSCNKKIERDSAPSGGGPLADGACAGREAPGLVSFTTSHTGCGKSLAAQAKEGDYVVIDPRKQRTARCRKSLLNAARLVTHRKQKGGFRYRVAFLTLTYADCDAYRHGHIAEFMTHVRNWLRRRGVRMCGCRKLEMQKRGAVHYHLMIWLPKGMTLPKPDKQGWWKHGSTKCEWLRNGYGYVAKYIGKEELDQVPKGARLYSVFGLELEERREIAWWNTPEFVREAFPQGDDHSPVRCPGGGWISKKTGEVVFSEWQFGGFNSIGAWATGTRIRMIRLVKRPAIAREQEDMQKAYEIVRENEFWKQAAIELHRAENPFIRMEWPEYDREEPEYVFNDD